MKRLKDILKKISFTLLILAIISSSSFIGFGTKTASAASSGPLSPGTATASLRFTNANNIKVSDNTYSGVSFTADNQYAQFFAQNYGFSIPTGSTIDGISVTIEKRADGGTTKDSIVSLFLSDGATTSNDNKADTSTFWVFSKMTNTYGSSSDLWGNTWTAEDINDVDFGVFMRFTSNYQYAVPGIDFVSVTVYYTAGGGGGSSSPTLIIDKIQSTQTRKINSIDYSTIKRINLITSN